MESEQRHHSQRRLKTRDLRTSEHTALPAYAQHFETHRGFGTALFVGWIDHRSTCTARTSIDAWLVSRCVHALSPCSRRCTFHSAPAITEQAITWHQFDTETFDLGRDEVPVRGADLSIGLYSPERCIADAFRLRGQLGYEIARDSLRE